MNKKLLAFFSLFIILVFIGYIVYDTATTSRDLPDNTEAAFVNNIPDQWNITMEILCNEGKLTSVSVSDNGRVYLGGDSFISCYDPDLKKLWSTETSAKINSLSVSGDTAFCATEDMILLFNSEGKMIDEWGPFEDNSIITSVTSSKTMVAFSDAGNKMVFVLAKDGRMKSLMGKSGESFIIPSPYFDVAFSKDNSLYVANTGHRRIETRSIEGDLLDYFGSPGMAPEAFCGCCNPAHFIWIPQGFITAEKGLNRIKILDSNGAFVEWVSSENNFTSSIPLDLASSDGKTIYAANPANSKLIVFKRKN